VAGLVYFQILSLSHDLRDVSTNSYWICVSRTFDLGDVSTNSFPCYVPKVATTTNQQPPKAFTWCWWRSFNETKGEEGKKRKEKRSPLMEGDGEDEETPAITPPTTTTVLQYINYYP